jgi:predicted DCC family thiol-disulfide oxidoreductase YuxK
VEAVLLYDADCGFCRWCVAKALKWDRRGRLRPVALQDPAADELLAGLDDDERMASWHLVDGDGRRYSGGAAFAPLLSLLPRGGRLARLAARFPRLVEAGYSAVASRRSWFGRLLPVAAKRRANAVIGWRASDRPQEGSQSDADRRDPGGGVRGHRHQSALHGPDGLRPE